MYVCVCYDQLESHSEDTCSTRVKEIEAYAKKPTKQTLS